MRKLSSASAAVVAAAALMGLTPSAFANHIAGQKHDLDCGPGGKYPHNPTKIFEFKVDSPDSKIQLEASGIGGKGIACGTAISGGGIIPFVPPPVGDNTLYERADVTVPPGVVVTPTATQDQNRVSGHALVNVLFRPYPGGQAQLAENQKVLMRVDKTSPTCGGVLPAGGTLVACYSGVGNLGSNHNVVYDTGGGKLGLRIGPIVPVLGGGPTGLSRIKFDLCKNFGNIENTPVIDQKLDPMTAPCNTTTTPVQFNGLAPIPGCPVQRGNKGVYTATATQKGGAVAGPVSSCVKWVNYKMTL